MIGGGKNIRLVAPLGGVVIGTPDPRRVIEVDWLNPVSDHDVWLQFNWAYLPYTVVPFLVNRLVDAIEKVAEGGVIHIEPGFTNERIPIGVGKRFTIEAPIGDVTIG